MHQKLLSTVGAVALAFSASVASAAVVSFEQVSSVGGGLVLFESGLALPMAPPPVNVFDGAATAGGSRITVDAAAAARTAGNLLKTSVGDFRGLGGTGSGTSVTGDGAQIQIRSGNNAGRFNVLDFGRNFLDSNDTLGFSWTIANQTGLRGASAFITDPNDAGGKLNVRLTFDGDTTPFFNLQLTDRKDDATIWKLMADFTLVDRPWSTAVFEFRMDKVNDGIGLSNAALNVIPLPAPALLLLSGLGALGGLSLRRRRR